MSTADRAWPILRRLTGVHTTVYRLTSGLVGHRLPGAPPILLLDHVGARTHTPRTTPLVYVTDGPDIVIVASKGGHPKHPAWYHNLVANPDVRIETPDDGTVAVHAEVLQGAERDRAWDRFKEASPGFRDYEQRTSRTIPVLTLRRRTEQDDQAG